MAAATWLELDVMVSVAVASCLVLNLDLMNFQEFPEVNDQLTDQHFVTL